MAKLAMSETVTPEHLMVFGGVIHGFARIEGVIIATLASLAKIDMTLIMILMRQLGYEAKRDALYSYFELYETAEKIQQPIRGFLDKAHEYVSLRNHIAHSYWRPGKRPDSIKPVTMKVRGGKGKVIGLNADEPDYLVTELAHVSDNLRMIHNSLLGFLSDQGLLSDIDQNILAKMSESSPSEGADAK